MVCLLAERRMEESGALTVVNCSAWVEFVLPLL